MSQSTSDPGAPVNEKVAVVGSGAIACGLAAVVAAKLGEAVLVARSDESARKARKQTAKQLERMEFDGEVTVDVGGALLAQASYIVEAIAEDFACKAQLLAELHGQA